MDADSSYGGSDTAQDLHSNHDNNSFNDTTTTTTTTHTQHDTPSTTITVTTPTTQAESNNFYHKNEITLPVNYDENDYQKQPNYLTTANLNINESLDNPSSNLEEMSKNFKSTSRLNIMDDNQTNGGLDNPAFMKTDDDVDDDNYNNKLEIKSTFDNNRPYNGDLNTTAALGLSSPNNHNHNNNNNNNKKHDEQQQQQLAEAVNLELINLKPTNGKDVTGMYENGMSTIPIKKENDNEIGNPYDEYFVPVNEHRKYMRGEKLYVTMDKRNKKTRNKCLCWGVCLCIVAAAVIIGILAAVGVIGNQGAHPVQEVSARHFSNGVSETPVKIGGGIFGLPPDLDNEDVVTTIKPTPGPPISTVSSLLPTTETSMIQVPRALESQLVIDNLQFTPELNDTNSAEFKQLAQILETELKHSLFDNSILNHGPANIEVKVIDFAPGSVVVRYRIVWTFKDGIRNPPDPINADMAKRKLRSLLAKNDGLIGDYSVSERSVIAGPVLDSCRIDNYGCEFNCSFDYHLADFICICPEHKILASDKRTCINYDENSLPDFPFEPEATNPPEDIFDVHHHDYHETIVQPTSEPTSEPEPIHDDNDHYAHLEPELTTIHPQAEPEATNPPEETYDVHHNYHETIVQPTSEPTSEPSPQLEHENTDHFAQPEPEPTSKPEPEPVPTVKEEIEPEINTQSNHVSHENYIHIQEITSPSPEPSTESHQQSNEEPVAEPTSEPAPEPTSKSVSEVVVPETSTELISGNVAKSTEHNVIPIIHAVTEPAAEPTAEPNAEPAAEPTAEPAAESTVQPAAEPNAEPAAEPTAEPAAEPNAEPAAEPTAEPAAEPTAEPAAHPIVEPAAEPTVQPAAEPNTELSAEVTAEPAAEPTVQPIPEPSAEPSAEPAAEPTPQPAAEPTPEPTTKPDAEAVAVTESTHESTSKPTELNVLAINPSSESASVEPTTEAIVESTVVPQLTVRPVSEPLTEPPAAEPTPEPKGELAAETTIIPSRETITENTVKSEAHDSTHIINLPIEPEIEPTAEPTAEPTVQPTVVPSNEPMSDNIDKSVENNAVNINITTESVAEPTVEPTVEPATVIPPKPSDTSVDVISESVTEQKVVSTELNATENISVKPETKINFATSVETTETPSIEEITELPKEIESPRSFETNPLESNDSKVETTMESITESNSKIQEDSENYISKTLVETTSEAHSESSPESIQNVTEVSKLSELTNTNESISVTEKVSELKLETAVKHENETSSETSILPAVQPESSSDPVTESPSLSVIPLEEATEVVPEQPQRQSKVSNINPEEIETTTIINTVSSTSEKLMEEVKTTTSEEPQQQINSVVVSVNENKAELKETTTEAPQQLLISVNNATEIVNLEEPKIYEITTPTTEMLNDSNEIHSPEIDQHNFNISHLNIIQESTENNGVLDIMSPFLPEIDNDTFVNKLHLGEHFVEHHTEEIPPPRLDNDEKNETNPIDFSHKINETDNIINSTEIPINTENIEITTIRIQDKLEKSTLPPEIINNVHSNQFFENLKEIKHIDELKNNSGVDSSTEDLLALETTTNHQNITENSVETNNATIIHAEILQTATETINVISENTENVEESTIDEGYKVKEAINDVTTTEKIFVPKIAQTTTEIIRLATNPDEDLSVIPLGSLENDISAEEHSVLDKFSRQIDEIPTTIETIIDNPGKCQNDQFLCTNGTGKDGSYCISMKNRCDSTQDCSDGSDELDCKGNCHENFQCANGQCLKRYRVCDGIPHCTDGSDEINCNQWNCTIEEFSCGDNQRCLPLEWRCDGRKHCPNGIDEHNCNLTCPETSYHCKDEDICIPKTWRCDGKSDCSNFEDEQSCNCEKDQFRCSLGGGCIDYKQRCDGIEDCPDRSDEWNCIRLQDRIVEIEIANNTWSRICSDNWNQTYSDTICNNLGYSGSSITENLSSGNFSNYMKLKSEQLYNVPILKQFENSDSCENVVAVTCQEFSCGSNHQTIDDQQARIVGGSRSTETQWSSLSLLYNKKLNIQCTATILTPIWVIASYSCVNNGSNWVLYAGNTNYFNNPENATTQMVEVERILQHPQVKFSQFEYTNDVVLIKLKKPLILTRNVSAVCLPVDDIETRQLCVIAGWGVSQPGERNNQYLHYLPVPIIDNNECNSTKHYNGLITDDKICAGFTDSTKTPCYDDEGAPLMCFSDSASIWELQGVLSYHDNCGSGNHPAIYTSLNQNIKNWIINTIGKNSLKRA